MDRDPTKRETNIPKPRTNPRALKGIRRRFLARRFPGAGLAKTRSRMVRMSKPTITIIPARRTASWGLARGFLKTLSMCCKLKSWAMRPFGKRNKEESPRQLFYLALFSERARMSMLCMAQVAIDRGMAAVAIFVQSQPFGFF